MDPLIVELFRIQCTPGTRGPEFGFGVGGHRRKDGIFAAGRYISHDMTRIVDAGLIYRDDNDVMRFTQDGVDLAILLNI